MLSAPFTTLNCVFQVSRKFSEMKHISPLILVTQVNVGEVKSHLPPGEIHFPEENHREVLEDMAVGGEYIGALGLFRI